MDKLKELAELYEELVDDDHQQFVGEFEYEALLQRVRHEIMELERSINFGFDDDLSNCKSESEFDLHNCKSDLHECNP
jgi:hypothetical protein